MDDVINHLHDATLVSIQVSWQNRRCEMVFEGAPKIQGPFSLMFVDVTELHVSATMPWVPSASVLAATVTAGGCITIEMQSGDVVSLVSPNFSSMDSSPKSSGGR